jgi:Bacterial antitoxin of type II TA system, VapB
MASHMKTTVHIPDALLAEVQALAARENTTFKALVQEGLRDIIAKRRTAKEPFKLKDGSVGGHGLNPELEGASWETIRDIIYEGRGS